MNTWFKLIFAVVILAFISLSVQAQTTSSTGKKGAKKAKAAAKTPIPGAGKPTKISIHNLCEKSVSVFAGPKTALKNPKTRLNACGGLSNNIVYVKVADVVCLMNEKLTPVSCADVKLNTKTIEVNVAGKALVAK